MARRRSKIVAAIAAGGAVMGMAKLAQAGGPRNPFSNPTSPICKTKSSDAPNVRTDCEYQVDHNGTVLTDETSISVNPRRPANIVAVADDNQILFKGKTEYDYAFPRVRTSIDGGRSWTTYPINWGKKDANDSEVAFDSSGTAYISAIARVGDANPDIYVTHSGDGGRGWSDPALVAAASGNESDGIQNDQDALAAWGNGNAIVTWAQYHIHRGYQGSPIMAAMTHDGGRSWTKPLAISGSAPFCLGAAGDHACDQAQDAEPVVTADGHVLVSFVASDKAGVVTNISANTLMVVELDPSTGVPIAGPYVVAKLSDGTAQYPVSDLFKLPTLHDSQFLVGSLGNIAADPTNPAHLAEVWSDMRNSTPAAPPDPYVADTNSDIVMAQSFDHGRSWSAPAVLALANDQFQPSAVYDPRGRLRIGYFDRSYDPANNRYGYSLATETAGGSLRFDFRSVTTVLSDPTRDDHLDAQGTVNAAFPHPTRTIGDHGALAITPTGVIAYWTDLRDRLCFGDDKRCGTTQGTYVARLP